MLEACWIVAEVAMVLLMDVGSSICSRRRRPCRRCPGRTSSIRPDAQLLMTARAQFILSSPEKLLQADSLVPQVRRATLCSIYFEGVAGAGSAARRLSAAFQDLRTGFSSERTNGERVDMVARERIEADCVLHGSHMDEVQQAV